MYKLTITFPDGTAAIRYYKWEYEAIEQFYTDVFMGCTFKIDYV